MGIIKITADEWDTLKLKLTRKYIGLTEEDLAYKEGEESVLIERLAKRLHRKPEYVLFTLGKQLEDLSSNRL